MFEYYFLITFPDGAVVDVPAGKTAFLLSVEEIADDNEGAAEPVVRRLQLKDAWRMGDDVPDCVSFP